jgi:sugar lactone lactonase YvrE
VFVGAGFHLASVFRVSPDGIVTVLAANLGDPEGVALDGRGHLYVAESSFHRVLRFNVRS